MSQTLSRWQPYPTYKPSGVEWLGDIPEHWEGIRLKMLSQVRRGASPRPIDDPTYFDDEGEYAWVRIADVTASERYLTNTTQRLSRLGQSLSVALEPGEIFLSIAGTVGKAIITEIKCCIHDGFVYFKNLNLDREFLYYVFTTGEIYKGLGKLGTQLNLNTETVGGITVPVPPSDEQQLIVDFLDYQTARLDALIAKKQELIERLHEQRAALISHAVTKGLNPDAPLKDSGIEWLGEIPSHWEIVTLRRALLSYDYGISDSLSGVGKYIVLTMGHIQNGKLLIPEEGCLEEKPELILRHHDLVFNRTNSLKLVGKVGLFEGNEGDDISFASYLVRLRANETAEPEYLN